MKTIRFRIFALATLAAIMLLALACTPQRYSTHRAPHPKNCNCPSF